MVVLPLATLLALQLKFLAYQAEGITWAQRVAVFLDVGFLVVLWPAILHRSDDWKTWWRETLAAYLPKKRAWLAMIVLVASVVLILFAATPDLFAVGFILGAMVPLLLIVLVGGFSDERLRRAIFLLVVLLGLLAVLWALMWGSESSLPSIQPVIPVALFLAALPLTFFWHPTAPRGSLALLSASILAPLLTLGLMVDGEFWETVTAKLQKPLLNWQMLDRQDTNKHRGTLAQQFENDRCASIGQTVLSCVVLDEQRRLDLNEQALFVKPPNPELLAALRAGKGLENIDKLGRIFLAHRSLRRTQMRSTLLVGADLRGAQLQGASLLGAQLQGASLLGTQLQSASLSQAQLQGADLRMAQLQGADLRSSGLYRNGGPALSDLLDIRGTVVEPLSHDKFSAIQVMLESIPFSNKQDSLRRLKLTIQPGAAVPTFDSCIADRESQPKCQQVYDVNNLDQRREVKKRLHEVLAALACEDAYTAQGILGQIPSSYSNDNDSTRQGLATVLLARMKASEPCPGLAGLSAEYKAELERLAKKEEAKRQQAAKAASAGQR
ncbi:pentapeptide repeat-containing protein [Candidatus Competibacter phosphatis]|nr:pentapeptide repeat-containing protein [Candidatus Competibacter phosphatis]